LRRIEGARWGLESGWPTPTSTFNVGEARQAKSFSGAVRPNGAGVTAAGVLASLSA
jgi:hypothetical protein